MIKNRKTAFGKKGMVFEVGILIVTIIVVIATFLTVLKRHSDFDNSIGDIQLATLESYQTGENTLLFIDESAVLTAHQTLYDLGKSGALYSNQDCGEIDGYNYWLDGEKDCTPNQQQFEKTFEKFFLQNLKLYSANPPFNVKNPDENHDISLDFDANKIYANARTVLSVHIYNKVTKSE